MRYKQAAVVESSKAGDRLVLFHTEDSVALVLNPAGAMIWRFLTTGRSRDEVVTHLVEHFEPSEADLAGDVDRFFESLNTHRMLDALPP